jgi:hypothetical protein
MPILETDLIIRPGALVSDTTPAQNGGRMATNALASGVKNNLFPDVSLTERTNGGAKFRKVFAHVNRADLVPLQAPKFFLDIPSPGPDMVVMYAGTQTDTQNQVTGRPYGVGVLGTVEAAGSSGLAVDFESLEAATLEPIRAGDTIRIGANTVALGGVEEFATVVSAVYSGASAVVTLSAPLSASYSAGAFVASIYAPADVLASISGAGVGPGALGVGGMSVQNKGAIYQTWTLTFSSATDYTVAGDTVGPVAGAGNTSTAFAPNNPATGSPYFTLAPGAFVFGGFSNGSTVSFTTEPATVPLWLRRKVPAGAGTYSNNRAVIAILGESV